MKRRSLTPEEIERRLAEIDAQPAEKPTGEDLAAFAAADAEDDGTTMTLEEFKRSLEKYSGKLVIRIPRSLHKKLKEEAEAEGVSLNQYMLYKLAQ